MRESVALNATKKTRDNSRWMPFPSFPPSLRLFLRGLSREQKRPISALARLALRQRRPKGQGIEERGGDSLEFSPFPFPGKKIPPATSTRVATLFFFFFPQRAPSPSTARRRRRRAPPAAAASPAHTTCAPAATATRASTPRPCSATSRRTARTERTRRKTSAVRI